MRIPPEATTSAMSDPVQWLVLIGFGLAWVVLAGLAVSIGLLVAVWRGGFRSGPRSFLVDVVPAKRRLPRA
jgi:hypothetical protein